MSLVYDWPIWVKVVTSIFSVVIILIHFDMARGKTFTPFNGRTTAMGFLIQMVLLVIMIFLPAGIVKVVLGLTLLFFNWTNFTVLKRAVNGLQNITPDNPRGD